MFFIGLLIFGTMLLATTSGVFSVWGLAQTFHGVFWSVIAMGIALEYGKLIAASFLYRYSKQLSVWMKTYLVSAVVIIMLVTAMGHFGYLSSGYQTDSLPLKEISAKIELLKQEQTQLRERKKEIDTQVSKLPENFVKGRRQLMSTFASELKHINSRLPIITTELQQLSSQQITTQSHVGPIVYIASAMGKDIDDATKYLILLIIFVFDPLAVVLTLGVNIALRARSEELKSKGVVTPNEKSLEPLNETMSNTPEDITVDNKVADVLTLSSSDLKSLVSDELQEYLRTNKLDHSEDPTVTKAFNRNRVVSDMRTGLK